MTNCLKNDSSILDSIIKYHDKFKFEFYDELGESLGLDSLHQGTGKRTLLVFLGDVIDNHR